MTREAATRAARLELGSAESVKDSVRDVGWESTVESVWQDVRYAHSQPAQIARFHRGHGADAGARHRGDDGNLQPARCGHPQVVAGQES